MSGIYIHIPFCERKCFYCDFYSIDNLELREEFSKSLSKELFLRSVGNEDKKVDTIYFGGGTPSVMDPKNIDAILQDINYFYSVSSNAEITIECNPNSLTAHKLKVYSESGINRISLGVQSFIDSELSFLQRLHNSDMARKSINDIFDSGFNNLSLDLIYAVPNSNLKSLEYNLSELIKFKPQHISAYSLIYEEGTPLYNEVEAGSFERINEFVEAEMYGFVMKYLQDNGYDHYEVSNYSLPGFKSRHNSNYWNHTEYLGFGPSAHSFINGARIVNYPDIRKYFLALSDGMLPVESEELLTNEMFFEECVFLGLRSSGINLNKLNTQFNIDFLKKKENIITSLNDEGFIILSKGLIRLTDKGFLLCDEICRKLM
jgi:oxygen-independent coproporphyrinogen III oxidase